MPPSLEFILGLLDRDCPAHVSQEDFAGEHGGLLRLWQRLGFLATVPGQHPVPSCPHCREGVPSRLGGRYVCHACQSAVDHRHALLWRFDLEAFLMWIARALHLEGGVRQIDERLWQLGSFATGEHLYECFFRRSGPLSERGRQRLLAYRNSLLLRGGMQEESVDDGECLCLSLLEVLRQDRHSLKVTDLTLLLRSRGAVRFDEENGALWVGDLRLGEVPLGSKEFHFLACLSRHLDRFVPYGDIKHHVLRHADSVDATEEATFCQKLKRRVKKKWVPKIDFLIATTNKGDGYRLRGSVEL